MKKTLLTAVVAAMGAMSLQAQTIELINIPQSQDEAAALGWEGAWGDLQYGAVMPANYVMVDNENIKVTVENPAIVSYPAKQAGASMYSSYVFFGSQADRNGSDAVYDLSAIYRDNNAIFTVEPVVNGKITLHYNRGTNNSTAYVWDMTAGDGVGACVLSNMTFVGSESEKKIHTPEFSVVAGHKYYIFSSDNGVEMYRMTFDPYTSATYTATLPAESDYLLKLPANKDEAAALGWEGAWGDLQYGGVMPANTVLASNENIKVTVENPAIVSYPAKQAGAELFASYVFFGSQVGRDGTDAVYDLSSIYRDNNAIFTVEPVVNGKMTLVYNRGTNNSTAYVWDATAGDGVGACVLSNMTYVGSESEKKIHTPSFFVTSGHKYYIFSSDNGVEFYNMAFVPYTAANYYSAGTDGIENVTSAPAVQSNRIYTVDGRFAGTDKANLVKGIYIMNGKKVVVD